LQWLKVPLVPDQPYESQFYLMNRDSKHNRDGLAPNPSPKLRLLREFRRQGGELLVLRPGRKGFVGFCVIDDFGQ
jgi:hypothetical protein